MPIDYRIDTSRNLVLTTARGVLTGQELLEHKRALAEDAGFKSGMRELSDVRAVERLDVSPDVVRQLAEVDAAQASRMGDHKLAILVSKDIVFGMARMYEMLAEGSVDVQVFRDRQEAESWLEIEPS